MKGKRVELFETQEGILLKPVTDAIKEARGFLKGTNISSQKYMQLKKEENELDF